MSDNSTLHAARKHIIFGLKLAAVIIGAGLLLALARQQGLVDAELVMRANNVIMGLVFVVYFNAMPKMLGPQPLSIRDATVRHAIGRVGSWAMTLTFLVWVVLWAFAPPQLAKTGSMVVVGAGVVVMFGYTAWKIGFTVWKIRHLPPLEERE